MTDLIDTRLGQYHLKEEIGRGGMAIVYKAFQPNLERFVAIKALTHNRDPQFTERFKREARTLANLTHPNILPIFDYGEQDNVLYLVLQYIEGSKSLADLQGKPVPIVEALRLIARLLEALEFAHVRGIIHRDIKPSNVLMLSPSWPMLADFGIAKLMSHDQSLTASGMIVGTVAYMAPEQATGRPVDARTDLYAVGVVLYELLTGRVPFEADTPIAVLIKHTYEPPVSPRKINTALPVEVEAVLLRALAKDPADRYQTAGEMAQALTQVAAKIEQPVTDMRAGLYQSGVQAFQAGRWETAIEQFSRLLAIDPSYEDASRWLDNTRKAQSYSQQSRAVGEETKGNTAPVPKPAVERHCPKCNKVVQPDWTACPYCRSPLTRMVTTPLDDGAGASKAPTTHTSQNRRWLWVALPVLLALLIGSGVWAMSRDDGTAGVQRNGTPDLPTAQATAAIVVAATDAPATAAIVAVATDAPAPSNTPAPSATPAPSSTPAPSATPAPTAPPLPEAATLSLLNMRGGPGTNYPVVGQYPEGTALRVLGQGPGGEWIKIQTPDEQIGWMTATNLQINLNLADVPPAEAPPLPTSPPQPTRRPIQPTKPPPPTDPPPVATEPPPPPTEPPPTATPKPDDDDDDEDEKKPPRKPPPPPP